MLGGRKGMLGGRKGMLGERKGMLGGRLYSQSTGWGGRNERFTRSVSKALTVSAGRPTICITATGFFFDPRWWADSTVTVTSIVTVPGIGADENGLNAFPGSVSGGGLWMYPERPLMLNLPVCDSRGVVRQPWNEMVEESSQEGWLRPQREAEDGRGRCRK
jgi:hypothetical protein